MTSNSHHPPSLPDINDVDPLSPADHACIEEIREVLLRRGCLQRFGLMLLHRHFPLSDDEILVESIDVQTESLRKCRGKSHSSGQESRRLGDLICSRKRNDVKHSVRSPAITTASHIIARIIRIETRHDRHVMHQRQ